MRLTDRMTHSERRGLIAFMLIMAIIVAAMIVRSYGSRRQVEIVRDTVTIFVPVPATGDTMADKRPVKNHHRKRKNVSGKKNTPVRNPLDEPVPLAPSEK